MNPAKELQDLTLEELWQLFPIVLSPHQPQWKEWAREEIEKLSPFLSAYSPIINHIGSTAIPAIWAKPIIDILVEVPKDADWIRLKALMNTGGYICMNDLGNRMSFNKGYTPQGYADRVFHVHFHTRGDHDEVLFRDYLQAHPSVAKEYETLKLGLLPEYRHDRDGYTEAKSEFVNRIVTLAKPQKTSDHEQTDKRPDFV